MGTEAVWVPYVVAALAAGGSAANAEHTARKQDQAASAGIRAQSVKQRQADQRVSEELDTVENSNAETARATSQEQFMDQLRRTRAQADGSIPAIAGASDRYAQDVTANSAGSDAQASRIADLMSRINAPSLQRQQESQGFGRLATDIGQIGRASAGEDFLTQLRVRSIRNNPWVDALASTGSAYAGGMAGNGGTTTAAGGMSKKPTVTLASQFK